MGVSYEVDLLRRIRLAQEVGVANYGVDQTTAGSSVPASPTFIDLPIVEGTWQPGRNQEQLDPQTIQQTMDDREKEVLGKRSSSVAFSTILAGTGILLDGTQAAAAQPVIGTGTGIAWALGRLIDGLMGGTFIRTPLGSPAATKIQTSSTSTSIIVTSTHGTLFTVGGCIALKNTTTNRIEVREIKSINTDTIVPKVAFGFSPAANNTEPVYSGPTFYLKANPLNTLQIMEEGAHDYDRFVYPGLFGEFGIETKSAGFPKLAVKLTGNRAIKGNNATLGLASYTTFAPGVMLDSEFLVATVGSTTRTVQPIADTQWNPAITWKPVTTTTAADTILQGRRMRKNPAIAGTFNSYWDNVTDFYAGQAARTQYAFFQQIGSVFGGPAILISAPTVQIMTPQEKATEGIAGMTVAWKGRNDQEIGSASQTDLLISPWRIHVVG